MKPAIGLFLMLVNLMLYSCSPKNENNNICNGSNTSTSQQESIVKDIPFDKTGKPLFFNGQKYIDSLLGLCTITDGFDEWQVRIAYYFSRNDTVQYLLMSRSGGDFLCKLYTVVLNTDIKNQSLSSIQSHVINLAPKTTWNQFESELFATQIKDLPDDSKIEDYPQVMDEDRVIVQIATPQKYRLYSYSTPQVAENSIPQAKQMLQILTLLKTEFGFNWLRWYVK